MSAPANSNPQSAYGVRRTLTALIAAAALALILHAIAAAPVAAATTVRASVARGTLADLRDAVGRPDRASPQPRAIRTGSRSTSGTTGRPIGRSRSVPSRGSTSRPAAGNDRIRLDTSHGAFTTSKPTRVHGGAGNDTLIGGNGNEAFFGGTGNDVVDGNGGADTVSLGSGNDTLVWDPGDGSDVVRGGAGSDTLVFNGSSDDEELAATANGTRVRFTRTSATS